MTPAEALKEYRPICTELGTKMLDLLTFHGLDMASGHVGYAFALMSVAVFTMAGVDVRGAFEAVLAELEAGPKVTH